TVIEDSSFITPVNNVPLVINISTHAPVTVRRVRAESGGMAMLVGGSATITDTLATAQGGPAISAFGQTGGGPGALRNVTAISSGRRESFPSYGLEARGCAGSGCPAGVITARDVIARGLDKDVAADPAEALPGTAGSIAIDHSNFVTSSGAVAAAA